MGALIFDLDGEKKPFNLSDEKNQQPRRKRTGYVPFAYNQTTVRIEWQQPMGANCPHYINDIPTVFISIENPYHQRAALPGRVRLIRSAGNGIQGCSSLATTGIEVIVC